MNARVNTRAFVSLIWASAVTFSACRGRDRRPPPSASQPPARDTAEVAGEVAESVAAPVAAPDTTMPNDNAAWITDANALAMIGVMNARQIAQADVELEAWHSDTVRALAAASARDHAALQRSVDSLAERLRLAPVMSALGQRIDSEFQARVDTLRWWRGPGSLERAFVHQQVAADQAFASYANSLTGATRAPEVQALMQTAAARASAQVSRARSVEAILVVADSMKAAAIADSTAKAAERAAARAARRRRSPTP